MFIVLDKAMVMAMVMLMVMVMVVVMAMVVVKVVVQALALVEEHCNYRYSDYFRNFVIIILFVF